MEHTVCPVSSFDRVIIDTSAIVGKPCTDWRNWKNLIDNHIGYRNKKTFKNVTRCRDGMPKSMQTR